jgi:hypothetical protein
VLLNGPKTGFSHDPEAAAHLPESTRDSRGASSFDQPAASLQIAQHPAHHGSGKPEVLAAEQHDQFVISPARILAPQGQDGFGLCGCPGRLAVPMRPMRAVLQGAEVVWIIGAPPAIERLLQSRRRAERFPTDRLARMNLRNQLELRRKSRVARAGRSVWLFFLPGLLGSVGRR